MNFPYGEERASFPRNQNGRAYYCELCPNPQVVPFAQRYLLALDENKKAGPLS